MQIRHLHIERFGGWRQLDLPLNPHGLTVLYGPNETGKSTLLRFVRGVLYGFHAADETGLGRRPRRIGAAGRLEFAANGGEFSLRRESRFGTRGHAQLTRRDGGEASQGALDELLGGVSEEVFEHVFAVGLDELQRMASLQGAQVAAQIYEMSLGLDGERIVRACRLGDAARSRLLDVTERSGVLVDLSAAVAAIDREIAALGDPLQTYLELDTDTRRIDAEIADLKRRQRGMQEQLRGHAFLERVWGRWRRVQRLQSERDGLGPAVDFPADGVSRLHAIDSELCAARQRRIELRAAFRAAREQLRRLAPDRPFAERAAAIRALLDQADEMRGVEAELALRRMRHEEQRQTLCEHRQHLGTDWSEQRLMALETAPEAAVGLVRQAERYRRALAGRKRAIQHYQRLAAAVQQEQWEHAARLREFGGRDFDEVYQELTSVTSDLHELTRCLTRTDDGQAAVAALRRQVDVLERPRALPPYYYAVLGVFGVGGAMMALLGLIGVLHTIAGGPAPWTVGGIFMLLGTCCAGATWTMKRHFDPSRAATDDLRARLEDAESNLARERARSHDLWERAVGVLHDREEQVIPLAPPAPEQIERSVLAARQRLDLLADLERCDESLRERRRRLSVLRGRIREFQRRVSQSRRAWCDALRQHGLDESVRINATLETWQRASAAGRLLAESSSEHARIEQDDQSLREFDDQVYALARELGETGRPPRETLLAGWRRRLDGAAQSAAQKRAALTALRDQRREFRRLVVRAARLTCERVRLLAGVGARNRRDFLECERACQRRQELEEQLREARQELAEAAGTEPDLAVVEEDLVRFNPDRNRQAIDTLTAELADLEADLNAAHERLGRVRQELSNLGSDRTLARLRYDRAQAAAERDRAVEQLCAVELAARALDLLRARIEEHCQPETLVDAGRYLRRLTLGRYVRVWTPAGERRLVVDDDQGCALRVEQLSHGAREQLFLAVRLALIDRYRRRGIELPIILDDVVVNFDQSRTEAAVETLVEYAAAGPQVILLTCHLHLARLFESAGALPARLPDPRVEVNRRLVG